MENVKETQTKTQVFNLIILDKSGSMEEIRQAAVSGFNETLQGIKMAQDKFEDSQEHYVSLLTFCKCKTEYVYDKLPVREARPLALDAYKPCCFTPLYDAMGFALTSMRRYVDGLTDAVVVVTVITDGYENASKEYSREAVSGLVEELKNKGWTFTYMGANQDSVRVASGLSIRNARNFEFTAEGTVACMAKDADTRQNFFERLHEFHAEPKHASMRREDRNVCYSKMADKAFDEEEAKGKSGVDIPKRLSAIFTKIFI